MEIKIVCRVRYFSLLPVFALVRFPRRNAEMTSRESSTICCFLSFVTLPWRPAENTISEICTQIVHSFRWVDCDEDRQKRQLAKASHYSSILFIWETATKTRNNDEYRNLNTIVHSCNRCDFRKECEIVYIFRYLSFLEVFLAVAPPKRIQTSVKLSPLVVSAGFV